jgi:hypothetical protein
MHERFVVDWQDANMETQAGTLVSIRLQGKPLGLYRVKELLAVGMILAHGAIIFPVGTRLDIENLQTPGIQRTAYVVANDQRGLSLAW